MPRSWSSRPSMCDLGAPPSDLARVSDETALKVERFNGDQTDSFFDPLQLEGVDFPADKRALKRAL